MDVYVRMYVRTYMYVRMDVRKHVCVCARTFVRVSVLFVWICIIAHFFVKKRQI